MSFQPPSWAPTAAVLCLSQATHLLCQCNSKSNFNTQYLIGPTNLLLSFVWVFPQRAFSVWYIYCKKNKMWYNRTKRAEKDASSAENSEKHTTWQNMVIKLAGSAAPPSFGSTGKTGSEIANVQPEKKTAQPGIRREKITTWTAPKKDTTSEWLTNTHCKTCSVLVGSLPQMLLGQNHSIQTHPDFEHFLLCGFIVETTFGSAE
jgi:hypothetical protein